MAERFDMYYVDEKGDKVRPYIDSQNFHRLLRKNSGMDYRKVRRSLPYMAVSRTGEGSADFGEVHGLCRVG